VFLGQFPIADLRVCLWGDTAASELPYIREDLGGEMLRGVFGYALSTWLQPRSDFRGNGRGTSRRHVRSSEGRISIVLMRIPPGPSA
jgi:hypothetical protein